MAGGKKITLKFDNVSVENSFFENVALIGMTSNKAIYSVCHMLNHAFQLDFHRTPYLDITIGVKKEQFTFAVYKSYIPDTEDCYTLYKLKSGNINLLPGLKNIDYIWSVRCESDCEHIARSYIKALRSLPDIQFVSLLEKDKVKNLDYLIL